MNGTGRERSSKPFELDLLADTLAASLSEIYLFDPQTLLLRYANLGSLKNLGYSLPQIQAMTVLDIQPEFSEAEFTELIQPLLEHRQAVQAFKTVHRRADASIYPVDVHLELFEWAGMRVCLALIRDLTGRKQVEAALRESEEKYRQLFELESDALFLIDNQEGQILDANKAAERLYGYSRDELLRMRNVDLSAQPDQTRQATASKLTQIPVRYHRKRDGTVFPVEITAAHLTWDGRPAHIPAIRDITVRLKVEVDLRQSEEMMRYIIQHDPNAVAVYDRDLRYIAVSDRYLQDYNVQEDTILGKHHYDVFPEMPQKWKEVHQRVLAGAIESNEDDSFERPDGTVTYNRWECRPWYQADGSIGGMITYTEVTTGRKQAEMQLKEQLEELRRWQAASLGREMRVLDLKQEVNELLHKAGKPSRYPSVENDVDLG